MRVPAGSQKMRTSSLDSSVPACEELLVATSRDTSSHGTGRPGREGHV